MPASLVEPLTQCFIYSGPVQLYQEDALSFLHVTLGLLQ